jgi:NAD-dependent deacetylase
MEEIEMRITEIADIFLDSNHAVVLTGAGVSTESGIPDFRSPGSGLWTVVNPELFTIQGFKANPGESYRAGLPFYKMLQAAEPNAAHTVLAELEKRGLVKAIITQNVDSLLQKGGAKRVFEIHGTLSSVSCMHCGEGADLDQVIADVGEGLLPPLCIECGEPLKPDVVLFGEPLSPDYKQALEEAQKADLLLVVGSSMQVSPANQLPSYSDNLIIINRTPTFYDNQARVVIHESTARVMSLLLQELDGRQV